MFFPAALRRAELARYAMYDEREREWRLTP